MTDATPGRPTTDFQVCSVDGCTSVHNARGYCGKHYQKLKRDGLLKAIVKPTDQERFWENVDKTGDCWIWRGLMFARSGYGQFTYTPAPRNHLKVAAHAYSYEIANGTIPAGMVIDHRCRVRACVNPAHLRLATPKQNAENLGDDRVNNTSGVRGVYWVESRQKWRAGVQRTYFIGEYGTLEEAEEAVRAARREMHTYNDEDRK